MFRVKLGRRYFKIYKAEHHCKSWEEACTVYHPIFLGRLTNSVHINLISSFIITVGWVQEHSLYCHVCGKGIIQNSSTAVQSIQVPLWDQPNPHKQQNLINTRNCLDNQFIHEASPLIWLLQVKAQTSKGFQVSTQELRVPEGEGAREILLSISILISNCAPARAHYLNPLPAGYTTSSALRNNGLLAWASRAPSLFQCIRQVYTRKIEISVFLFCLFFFPLNRHNLLLVPCAYS